MCTDGRTSGLARPTRDTRQASWVVNTGMTIEGQGEHRPIRTAGEELPSVLLFTFPRVGRTPQAWQKQSLELELPLAGRVGMFQLRVQRNVALQS